MKKFRNVQFFPLNNNSIVSKGSLTTTIDGKLMFLAGTMVDIGKNRKSLNFNKNVV